MSHGIAIPIAKRVSPPFVDFSLYTTLVQHSVAKIQRGIVAYKRNTGEPHPLASGIETSNTGTGKRDTSSVPLANYTNTLWYGKISVGTPPRVFTVDFDTGSSDFFLPSNDCDLSCSGHKMYDPSVSTTSHDLDKDFTLYYGDGSSVSGEQYTDVVTISGLKAVGQTMGAATQYSSGFQVSQFQADGLMGMGFQSISDFNASAPFQTLILQNKGISPIFGLKLLAGTGSELFLGGVNPAYEIDKFTWANVTQKGYWQAYFDKVTVNKFPVLGLENINAIFDTGTTMIIGDPSHIRMFYDALSPFRALPYGGGFYTIPCDFNTTISIVVGGKEFNISPATFNLGPIFKGSDTCWAGAASSKPESAMREGFWILGDVFLQNVYSAWDVGNARIGFADLVW